MVEAQNEAMPQPAQNNDESDSSTSALQWTAQLVTQVDKKLRAAVSADELKKLSIDNAKPEFKKVLLQFTCAICTNVLDDFTQCADCEALICRTCLNQWLARDSFCPHCKREFQEMKVSRHIHNLINMCEFECPYDCGTTFCYENRKRHFNQCTGCSEQQKCPFCQVNISLLQNGLTWHVQNDCEGSTLLCPDCNLNVYQMYYDLELLQQNEGHECSKDMVRLVGLYKRLRQLEKF